MMIELAESGLLLPTSVLSSRFYEILAVIVALNTTVYAAVSLAHMLPHWFKPRWLHRNHRREQTRSIYPDGTL